MLAPGSSPYAWPGPAAPRRSHAAAATALEQALPGQLEPTWGLMWRAVELLRACREAATSTPAGTRTGRVHQVRRLLRDGGPPQPRRDGAVGRGPAAGHAGAASRPSYGAQRAFDDPLVMAEYRLDRRGVRGPGVRRRARIGVDAQRASGASCARAITVETADPVLAEPGDRASPRRPARAEGAGRVGVRGGARRRGWCWSCRRHGPRADARARQGARGRGRGRATRTFSDGYQPPPAFPDPDGDPVDARRPAAGVRARPMRTPRRNGHDPGAAARSRAVSAAILADLARAGDRGVVVDSPPGAGKSTLVVRARGRLAAADEPVMVVAQTNEQVDDLTTASPAPDRRSRSAGCRGHGLRPAPPGRPGTIGARVAARSAAWRAARSCIGDGRKWA